jgi:hypothetical protein
MTFLYPHASSWTAQTIVILQDLGIHVDTRRLNVADCLVKAVAATRNVEDLCFDHVATSQEKTLSFFRIFPHAATARDFWNFLSNLRAEVQDFLILFLSSGLRWRFFRTPSRGGKCPLCPCSFWSWEHFLQCRVTNQRSTLFLEVSHAAFDGNWLGVVEAIRDTMTVWITLFASDDICFTKVEIDEMCASCLT